METLINLLVFLLHLEKLLLPLLALLIGLLTQSPGLLLDPSFFSFQTDDLANPLLLLRFGLLDLLHQSFIFLLVD
jgi:hypothetical protein